MCEGAQRPFQQAVANLWRHQRTWVSEATCRRITYRSGSAMAAVVGDEAVRLQKEGATEGKQDRKLVVSADGSFIRLTTGVWREVKSVAVGEFATVKTRAGQEVVKTQQLSYFTRSYGARDFECFALPELTRRGVSGAETVVAVGDGAQWLQSFIDYHCPKAVRIVDFYHALGYVADAGKAIWGEDTAAFKSWFARCSHQLQHQPPRDTLSELRLLQPKAKRDEQAAAVDSALHYLQRRLEMIDYPFFQQRGYPIGSGAVESAHKHLVQRRLKQAGMRWAPVHVDPLLALRDLLSNERWEEGWRQITGHFWQRRHQHAALPAPDEQAPAEAPVTFAALKAAGLLPAGPAPEPSSATPDKPKRDPKDHPWRNNKWPTKESWRWDKRRQQK